MKYMVMECHDSYAVLMDEESRYVIAANLHYQVGQTVYEPILMNEKSSRSIKISVKRIAAAAACLALIGIGGYTYYYRNIKTYSVVLISSEADIKMGVNRKGKVLYLTSGNEFGDEILENYNGKGKDKLTVANEIIELQKDKGIISDGDTVDIYISTDKSSDYKSLKSELEDKISELQITPNVHTIDEKATKPAVPPIEADVAKPDAQVEPIQPAVPKPEIESPDKNAVKPPEPEIEKPTAPHEVTPPPHIQSEIGVVPPDKNAEAPKIEIHTEPAVGQTDGKILPPPAPIEPPTPPKSDVSVPPLP